MSRFSSAFKQVGPTRRIIQGENSFEKGMYWSTSVLEQGYVHTLLNYDIDPLNFTIKVSSGLNTTDVACGCTFLDRAEFGSSSSDILLVLQNRNEYNLRAFEGITNIISANKINIKDNQTLEEKLRQQGFTADDVVCYKILTYNPINHRLMSITLVQANRDKYFMLDNKYHIRRLNSNPISCGLSEAWEAGPEWQPYAVTSNRLDYHPYGGVDNYVPRARRNKYTETFDQKLHSPHFMQTVPNCEGYGNKTFCFNKKKQVNISGPIKDSDKLGTSNNIYLGNMNTGATIRWPLFVGKEEMPLDIYKYGMVATGCCLIPSSLNISTSPITIKERNGGFRSELFSKVVSDKIIPSDKVCYFSLNLNDGTITATQTAKDNPTDLKIQVLPIINRVTEAETWKLPPEPRLLDPENAALAKPVDPSIAFESLNITGWGNTLLTLKPTDLLKEDLKHNLRKGQGIRIAAYCKSEKGLTRYLNITNALPLRTKYYTEEVQAVFTLDYVWNGSTWEFSFIDNSIPVPYDTTEASLMIAPGATLIENLDYNGRDEFGNLITRHYTWTNCLTFTDLITERNINKMAKHIVDNYSAKKTMFNLDKQALVLGPVESLKQNLDETIDAGMPGISNQSKFSDLSYGHFEVKPKELTPGEAARWGYNMLANAPYTFVCEDRPGTNSASFTGLLLKDAQDSRKALLNPIINTPGILEIYYNSDRTALSDVNKFLQLKVEYKNPTDDWRILKNFSKKETHDMLSSGAPIQIPFSSPDETVLIRVTLTDTRENSKVLVPTKQVEQIDTVWSSVEAYEFAVMDQLITTLSYAKTNNQLNPEPEIFDLGSATGMTYWKGRLVIWGILNAENTLFLSEPNDPSYFAYPNGIDIFEENIIHAIPYSDALLVFTSTKLWRLDMSADGLSWNKTLLQQNLRLSQLDVPYVTIIKNLLFFKSGNQFYLLVPSRTSTTGELKIAPISNSIKEFLNNPFMSIREILYTTYPDLAGAKFISPSGGVVNDKGLVDIPDRPITDFLVKYGTHVEQEEITVDWWFDLADWKRQVPDYTEQRYQTELETIDGKLIPRKYFLVQLVYNTQSYSWTMHTHITNHIGVYVTDAANKDTTFINLTYSPAPVSFGELTKPTWGVALSHKGNTKDNLFRSIALDATILDILEPDYPRFQVLDTGYKEVSSPSLKKRFRELQLNIVPSSDTEEGLSAALMASIDGNTIMSSISQEVYEEAEIDPITGNKVIILKIVDRIYYHDDDLLDPNAKPNYVPLPYLVDGKLSNTFVLDSSAIAGVKNVKIRRQFNGKGYLTRARFVNITHANYSISNYAFVFHNKNAR